MLATIRKLTDQQLTATIHSAHRSLTIHKAAFLIHLAEFDERGLGGSAGTVPWLMRTQDLSRRTAYEHLGVGRKLREFPELADYFSSGDINYSKVRFLLPYLTPDNEAELVRLARTHTLKELETLLAGRPRADGRDRQAKNRLSVAVDKDTGGVRFWGTLDPANGAEFLASLKSAELAMGGDTDTSSTRFGAPLSTSLLGSFMSLLRLARYNPEAKTTAPGAQVSIIIRTDDTAQLPGQPAASGSTLLRSIINGFLSVQIHGPGGRILHLGRSSRFINRAQEKALLTRWNHCCGTPGCDHNRWLEFHHILPWAAGGTTDPDNLIPLCSVHHAMIANGELVIVPDPVDPTLLRFRFPGGESYTSVDNEPPMFNLALGDHSDGYTHGPVPRGDEDLLDIWEHEDTFDDIDVGEKP
ncbi:HNH endonuclease [Corynebacterium nasicanis]|uniref:HNH endonuclease n=1 Tax=Corynebacterium nasicanis TaxID=1448267 RepID=A0ABW1QBW5_9CORY